MKFFAQFLVVCTIADVLQSIRPGSQWTLNGSGYGGLIWIDSSTVKPTQLEILNAVSDCQTAQGQRLALKQQARLDVKDTNLTQAKRLQALLILLDYDQ